MKAPLALLALAAMASTARAQGGDREWDPGEQWQPALEPPSVQWSARYGVGLGAASAALGRDAAPASTLRIEQTLRTEALFGRPGDERFRLGPAFDLRFQRLDTVELAGGLAVLMPISRGYPLVLTVGAGYAFRSQPHVDGAFLLGTLAWGYRSYNFHSFYGLGLQIYVSTRVHLDDFSHYEITAGIEVDLAAMFFIPAMFFASLIRGGAPDEPTDAER